MARLTVVGGLDFGRHEFERDRVAQALSAIQIQYGLDVIIHGGRGLIASIVTQWGERNGIPTATEKVNVEELAKSARFVRNQRLLDVHKPTLTVVFNCEGGTRDLVNRLVLHEVPIIDLREPSR